MLTVTLDELELNAVLAALDDRLEKMGRQLITRQADPSPDIFAVDATRDAIRHVMLTKLTIAAAIPAEDAGRASCCGAEDGTGHWIGCAERPTTVPDVLWGIEQYQAESR